jgi:hypothetical protein
MRNTMSAMAGKRAEYEVTGLAATMDWSDAEQTAAKTDTK